jgi:predicted polyphosphate/ATP-dependent NAD kinase
VLGGAKDKLRSAGDGWQAVVDDLLVGVHLPGQEFIAPGSAEGAPVRAVEVLDNGAVIESEIIPVIFFFGEAPALSSRHLLEELHDERFAVNQDAVKIEDDGA